MKLKNYASLALCFLLLLVLAPLPVRADAAPKPTVQVVFRGLEGETYFATLLADTKSTGPHSLYEEDGYPARYDETDPDYDVFLKFVKYEAPDGYYFLQFFDECTRSHTFDWGYYPPQQFKVLLYFPDSDTFLLSDETFDRYAFKSRYEAQVTPPGATGAGIKMKKSYDYQGELLLFLGRVIFTILIELLIALPFGFYRKGQLRFIALVNLATQVGLNIALNVASYKAGFFAFLFVYIIAELVIIITEGALYAGNLKRFTEKNIPKWKPWVYALVANSFSFALGVALTAIYPGSF